MNDPNSQQEETKAQTVSPSEVWDQLSPDVQARVVSLLGRMAYKYTLAQCGALPEGTEVKGEIQGHESQDHA